MILINSKKKGYHQQKIKYSKLTDENINDSDYSHAKNVRKKINAKQWGIIMVFI